MSLISYSPANGQFYGFATITNLVGSFYIDLLDIVNADLLADVVPSDEYRVVIGAFTPFVKVTSNFDSLSFFSRPEAAYKFGSLQWVKAYERTSPPLEPPVYEPIPYASEYLIYPYQAFESRRYTLLTPIYGKDLLEVDITVNTTSPEEVATFDTRIFQSYSQLEATAVGLYLNLNQDVEASIKVFYSGEASALAPADFPNALQYVWL